MTKVILIQIATIIDRFDILFIFYIIYSSKDCKICLQQKEPRERLKFVRPNRSASSFKLKVYMLLSCWAFFLKNSLWEILYNNNWDGRAFIVEIRCTNDMSVHVEKISKRVAMKKIVWKALETWLNDYFQVEENT